MRHLIPSALVVTLCAAPMAAEEERGLSLMEQGAKLFFQGLMSEMEPAIDELETLLQEMGPALEEFAQEMGPKLQTMLDSVDDWAFYEAPEVLPNGDIIIRRKPSAPAYAEPETPEIEL